MKFVPYKLTFYSHNFHHKFTFFDNSFKFDVKVEPIALRPQPTNFFTL